MRGSFARLRGDAVDAARLGAVALTAHDALVVVDHEIRSIMSSPSPAGAPVPVDSPVEGDQPCRHGPPLAPIGSLDPGQVDRLAPGAPAADGQRRAPVTINAQAGAQGHRLALPWWIRFNASTAATWTPMVVPAARARRSMT